MSGDKLLDEWPHEFFPNHKKNGAYLFPMNCFGTWLVHHDDKSYTMTHEHYMRLWEKKFTKA